MAVLLAAAAWFLTPMLPWLDDAYISLDSAQSLLAGGDPQYGTRPLTGVTSPPYVLMLTALLGAGLEPLVALRAARAAGLAAMAAALWVLAGSMGLTGWRRAAMPVMILTTGAVIDQAINGVETGWAMAVAIALLAACVAGRPFLALAAAGVLPWLRPDLLPFAAVGAVAVLWRQPARVRVRAIAVGALCSLPWALWVYVDTGHWIPQTMAAKAAFFAESCFPLGAKLGSAGRAVRTWFALSLPAAVLAAIWVPACRLGRLAAAAGLATFAAYVVMLPGALWHNDHRYLYPIAVPVLALGMAVCLTRRELAWRAAAIAVLVMGLAIWAIQPSRADSSIPGERLAAAAWVREHVDAGARLLVQDAGVFSVFTSNPLVDLVGLKTPASVEPHRRWTLASCGADRAQAVAAIARSSGAEYLIVSSNWEAIFSLTEGLEAQGVKLERVRLAPNSPDDGYNVYRMRF